MLPAIVTSSAGPAQGVRRACRRFGLWSSHPGNVGQEGSPELGLRGGDKGVILQWPVLSFREHEGETESHGLPSPSASSG